MATPNGVERYGFQQEIIFDNYRFNMNKSSIYKSEAGRAAILNWYDQRVESLGLEVDSHHVETGFGRTHLLSAGPTDAPPVILLHGMNMNAAAMTTAIRKLAVNNRVHALDIIGMPGKSSGTRPSRKGDGYAQWLSEVMQGLNLEKAGFVGQSFGGWLILKLAAITPKYITAAALLGAGGLVSFTMWGQVVAGFTAIRHMIRSTKQNRFKAVRPFYASDEDVDPEIEELLGMTYQYIKMDIDPSGLPVLKPGELSRFAAPVFVSYGAHDIFFDASQAMQKADELFRGPATKEIVSNEGHLFSIHGEQLLYQRVADFFG
jgi:pimeloyl-ACP methyl ester carboxylesterase